MKEPFGGCPCSLGLPECRCVQACQLPADDLPMNGWDFVLAVFICCVFFFFVAMGPMTVEFLRSLA